MKCTPKVRQKTFGVYYVKEKAKEAKPIRLSPLYAYARGRI